MNTQKSTKQTIKKVGSWNREKNRVYKYKDLNPYNDWVKSSEYMPQEFDLCFLKNSDGRVYTGWWTGTIWDGNIKEGKTFDYWKRNLE